MVPKRSDVLKHHGVKGQQWGVRHGPPYPIEDKVLRKGTKIEHVTSRSTGGNTQSLLDFYKTQKRALYGYNPEDEHDTKVYRGPFAKYLQKLMAYRGEEVRSPEVHQFEVTEDLIMPTKKERVDAFTDMLKKADPKELEEMEMLRDWVYESTLASPDVLERIPDLDFRNLKTKQEVSDAYTVFNRALEDSHTMSITKKYMDYMAKHYDAMVDDNNVNEYNAVHDPLIILKVEKLKASPVAAKYLSLSEIMDNCTEINKRMSKLGTIMKY